VQRIHWRFCALRTNDLIRCDILAAEADGCGKIAAAEAEICIHIRKASFVFNKTHVFVHIPANSYITAKNNIAVVADVC